MRLQLEEQQISQSYYLEEMFYHLLLNSAEAHRDEQEKGDSFRTMIVNSQFPQE